MRVLYIYIYFDDGKFIVIKIPMPEKNHSMQRYVNLRVCLEM